MSEFKNKSITTKGMELLAKALAGETLQFTHIELGCGIYVGDVGEASSLVEKKQHLPITKIVRRGGQVTLSATLKLEDIKEAFNWSEIGVYAKGAGNIETLYMYGYTENTSYISIDSLNEKLIHVTVMVSSASEVTASIDNSLVYLTLESLNEHSNDQEAHEDIREKVSSLENQIGNIDISWEGITGKPDTFPPESHNHDERYYNKNEINISLEPISNHIENIKNPHKITAEQVGSYTKAETETLINNISVIKSIQSGVAIISPATRAQVTTKDITISKVDMARSMVIVSGDGVYLGISSAFYSGSVYCRLESSTKLQVSHYNGCYSDSIFSTRPISVYWQVIEFN